MRDFRSTNFPDIGEVVFATKGEIRLRCASLMPDFTLSFVQPTNVMMVLEYKATSKVSKLDEYVVLAFRFQDVVVPVSVRLICVFLFAPFVGLCRGIAFFLGMVVAARWWLGMEVRHRPRALKDLLVPVGHVAGDQCILYFFFFARTWLDAKLVALPPLKLLARLGLRWGMELVALSASAFALHWCSRRARVSLPTRF
jgi:hypothetical protein